MSSVALHEIIMCLISDGESWNQILQEYGETQLQFRNASCNSIGMADKSK